MNDGVTSTVHPGLWLVATPIGNLEDISPRAEHVLRTADVIFCEDTRHSGSLLKRIGVTNAKLVVANEHTEHDAIERMLESLGRGEVVAVITDAGREFNRGQRAFFFALAYVGWFVSPIALIITTLAALIAMLQRQFRSRAHAAIKALAAYDENN